MRFYSYRCTTDKLEQHLNRIQSTGDELVSAHYLGGRDWILICKTARAA